MDNNSYIILSTIISIETCVCVCVCERERERERVRVRERILQRDKAGNLVNLSNKIRLNNIALQIDHPTTVP